MQMVREINLLSSLPKSKRDIKARAEAKDSSAIRISKQFGYKYFDGDRKYGYGGFYYDGRWVSVAKDIIDFFGLKPGDRILDVGCAKGFLVYDLYCKGIKAHGLDISPYAILASNPEIRNNLMTGTAERLPYEDKSFDLIVSINTLHNLPRDGVIRALKEIERVSDKAYIVVDSYNTPEEKAVFESWVLTAETYGYPWEWKVIFEEAGYKGAYSWNLL